MKYLDREPLQADPEPGEHLDGFGVVVAVSAPPMDDLPGRWIWYDDPRGSTHTIGLADDGRLFKIEIPKDY